MFIALSSVLDNQIACVLLWLIIFVLALVIELATEQLVSVWFCGGAVVAIILAAFKVSFIPQLIVFIAVSAVLLVLSKTVLAKKLVRKDAKTNYDAIIGEKILITEKVTPTQLGAGKVRDVVWSVSSEDEIEAGQFAIVKEIKGNKLIVEKKEEK